MSYFNKFIIATGLALSRTIHGSSCVKTYATWPAVSFFLIANLYHLTFLALGSLRSRGEAKVEIAIFTETVLRRILRFSLSIPEFGMTAVVTKLFLSDCRNFNFIRNGDY